MKTYIISVYCFLIAVITQAQTGLSVTENYLYTKNCLDSTCLKRSEAVSYFDGAGKLRQTIDIAGSPLGKDLVQPVVYDAFGKKTRNYLPVPQSASSNGALYQQSSGLVAYPVNDATNFYSGEKIFTEKTIESSPLNRIQQQLQTGNDWNNKPAVLGYFSNLSTDQVRYFKTTSAWTNGVSKTTLIDAGLYGASQLYKNSIKDEDGNEKLIFKNTKGQVILERKGSPGNYADTYFVYDKYDHLVLVLPPLAAIAPDISSNETKRDNLCYQNRYDGKNRIAERKFPGKGWEYLIYDKQDRAVAIQDAVLKTKGQWLYIKYDSFGRVVITGISSGGERSSEQAIADGLGLNNVTRSTNAVFERQGMGVFYGNQDSTYPNSTKWVTLLSISYYDNYPQYSFNPPFPGSIFGQPVINDTQSVSTQGSPTLTLLKNIEDDNWTKNYVYYDNKTRAIGTYSINHLGGYTKNEVLLNFASVPQKFYTYHVRKPGEVPVEINERFVYDNQNRLKRHYHQVGVNPEELLSDNTYNEISQLVNKKVGFDIQSIDYSYNIRGWLTGINADQMAVPNMNGKLFSYKIKYNQKDGITNADSSLFPGKDVRVRYNGNIAEVDWRTVETIGVNPSPTPKRYGYAYDDMNRLTVGYYQNPQNAYSRENTESLDYNLNGNITNLYRTSIIENGNTAATVIDKLTYNYNAGNQISSIIDNGNPSGYEGGGGSIEYDLNGNMWKMADKNISRITYNHLNLPSKLEYGDFGLAGTTNYLYNAEGTKLQKSTPKFECGIIDCYTTTETTDYLDGFQYQSKITTGNGGGSSELLSVLEKSNYANEQEAYSIDDTTITEPGTGTGIIDPKNPNLMFFPTEEGFYDYQTNQYIYQYKDHLGNARLSFKRNSKGALQITDANDYYPFGMNHLKTGNAFLGSSYKNYKFLGKEIQESGFYDLDARFYMPDIGRFTTHDPLSDSTLDPYGYAYNNPLLYTDATGLKSDLINTGEQINGPPGSDGPGEDPKPNELGGSNRPYQIPEIVVNAPIRAMASNPASIMPSYCSVCYSGNGTSSGFTIRDASAYIPPKPLNWQCSTCSDGPIKYIGGIKDPLGVWEVLGMIISAQDNSNYKLAMLPLLVVTKNSDDALRILAAEKGAIFGSSTTNNYKATFFQKNPEVQGSVVVHHAVEQQALKRYPGLVTESEMHSLENLRGIPKTINSDVHLSQIRKIWNKFYKENQNPTKQQLLDQATEIDRKFGTQFTPPVNIK